MKVVFGLTNNSFFNIAVIASLVALARNDSRLFNKISENHFHFSITKKTKKAKKLCVLCVYVFEKNLTTCLEKSNQMFEKSPTQLFMCY